MFSSVYYLRALSLLKWGLKDTKSDECKRLLKGWNTGKDMNEFWNL